MRKIVNGSCLNFKIGVISIYYIFFTLLAGCDTGCAGKKKVDVNFVIIADGPIATQEKWSNDFKELARPLECSLDEKIGLLPQFELIRVDLAENEEDFKSKIDISNWQSNLSDWSNEFTAKSSTRNDLLDDDAVSPVESSYKAKTGKSFNLDSFIRGNYSGSKLLAYKCNTSLEAVSFNSLDSLRNFIENFGCDGEFDFSSTSIVILWNCNGNVADDVPQNPPVGITPPPTPKTRMTTPQSPPPPPPPTVELGDMGLQITDAGNITWEQKSGIVYVATISKNLRGNAVPPLSIVFQDMTGRQTLTPNDPRIRNYFKKDFLYIFQLDAYDKNPSIEGSKRLACRQFNTLSIPSSGQGQGRGFYDAECKQDSKVNKPCPY